MPQAVFMPWAAFSREVTVGPVCFWPFASAAAARIPDAVLRSELERRLQMHVDERGTPVRTVTMCSHGATDFRRLTDGERADIRNAADAIVFSTLYRGTKAAVCANNGTLGPPSADKFQLVCFDFAPGDNAVAVRTRAGLSAGWNVGEVRFPRPFCIGDSPEAPDPKLLGAFGKMLQPEFPADARARLFRALEWFRMAHTDADEVSSLSQIVMMATAFEILLQFPDKGKAAYFRNQVSTQLATAEFLAATRKDRWGKTRTRTMAEWWADDFYDLRSVIVHGNDIAPMRLIYRNWLTHLIVADLVFGEYVLRQLYAHRCLEEDVRPLSSLWEKASPASSPGALEPKLMRMMLGFHDAHRALDWAPEDRKRATSGWGGDIDDIVARCGNDGAGNTAAPPPESG